MPSCNACQTACGTRQQLPDQAGQLGTAFFGAMPKYRNITRLVSPISLRSAKNSGHVCCAFSSSSNGNGYMAGKSNENDEDYVNSTVLEAGNLF
jgi:hypothetical protein